MNVTLCYCAATIEDLEFTDKSDWVRRRNFSLEFECFEVQSSKRRRIQEAITEPIMGLGIETRCGRELGSILLVDPHNFTFIGSECDGVSLFFNVFNVFSSPQHHVNSLSEAHKEGKLRIESLEKELTNCTEEIGGVKRREVESKKEEAEDFAQEMAKAKEYEVDLLCHSSS
ncbi:hypothetical protein Csa_014361 [Cucumis sativus]|nr:hypothetical protein Csa_014361 [Cucumis sativus]